MAQAYPIDYNDQRFQDVETEKTQKLTEAEKTYGDMIDQSDKYYQDKIDAVGDWKDKQTQLQQEQTDFEIERIEQQKEQTQKDYTKEQMGAYADWQKESDPYGVNAEQMAATGMAGTGYSESSQVRMYNTYQNRVASARESYKQAVLNFENSITQAKLQNNSALAEISYNALQQQLELSLQGFQYKNTLILEFSNKKAEIENTYHSRWLDVLNQINTENALTEEKRQFDVAIEKQSQVDNSSASINKPSYAVSTAYYQGELNPDAGIYGTFKNGYQPMGISGHGILTKSGRKEWINTTVQYGANKGQKQKVEQNVWKAEDGTEWIWDGRNNKYVPA